MLLTDNIQAAVKGIAAMKGRSFLTMLGIIIGVGSVVLMTGIGASMEDVILSQISSIGAQSMVVFPGKQQGPPGQFAAGSYDLTFEDVEALTELQTITSIAPIVFVPGKSVVGREEVTHTVMGTTENFFRNQSIQADRGRLLEPDDMAKARPVVVLGPDTARDLFGNSDPLGKTVKVAGRVFTVIGITKPVGTQFFQNFDERLFVPLTLARSITGQKYVNYMTMQAVFGFDPAFRDVKSLLRKRHRIVNPEDDPDEDDFTVRSSAQANETLGAVSMGLTLFITLVAGVSLIVGGIGIMNIMLVTVMERTREIGLRKALGARRRDILLQFLFEAVSITLLGGLIGLILGVGLASFIALIVQKYIAMYVFALSPFAMLLALLVAALTGVVFGIEPARRAALVSPVEALRYE
jgi:putative ABC transport system permease protein